MCVSSLIQGLSITLISVTPHDTLARQGPDNTDTDGTTPRHAIKLQPAGVQQSQAAWVRGQNALPLLGIVLPVRAWQLV